MVSTSARIKDEWRSPDWDTKETSQAEREDPLIPIKETDRGSSMAWPWHWYVQIMRNPSTQKIPLSSQMPVNLIRYIFFAISRFWSTQNLQLRKFYRELFLWRLVLGRGSESVSNLLFALLCKQVIEISKGSKVKYELDKKTGLIMVTKLANSNAKIVLFMHLFSYH